MLPPAHVTMLIAAVVALFSFGIVAPSMSPVCTATCSHSALHLPDTVPNTTAAGVRLCVAEFAAENAGANAATAVCQSQATAFQSVHCMFPTPHTMAVAGTISVLVALAMSMAMCTLALWRLWPRAHNGTCWCVPRDHARRTYRTDTRGVQSTTAELASLYENLVAHDAASSRASRRRDVVRDAQHVLRDTTTAPPALRLPRWTPSSPWPTGLSMSYENRPFFAWATREVVAWWAALVLPLLLLVRPSLQQEVPATQTVTLSAGLQATDLVVPPSCAPLAIAAASPAGTVECRFGPWTHPPVPTAGHLWLLSVCGAAGAAVSVLLQAGWEEYFGLPWGAVWQREPVAWTQAAAAGVWYVGAPAWRRASSSSTHAAFGVWTMFVAALVAAAPAAPWLRAVMGVVMMGCAVAVQSCAVQVQAERLHVLAVLEEMNQRLDSRE